MEQKNKELMRQTKLKNLAKVRASRAYLEFIQIFRELKAVYKPAQDQKLKYVPLAEVKQIYVRMANIITEKTKREKHKIDEIEKIILK